MGRWVRSLGILLATVLATVGLSAGVAQASDINSWDDVIAAVNGLGDGESTFSRLPVKSPSSRMILVPDDHATMSVSTSSISAPAGMTIVFVSRVSVPLPISILVGVVPACAMSSSRWSGSQYRMRPSS